MSFLLSGEITNELLDGGYITDGGTLIISGGGGAQLVDGGRVSQGKTDSGTL